jgi:hypothetical protein
MIEHDIARAGARSPRWEVWIGSAVECPDGRAGRVAGVVVSPRTREVTHLIVRRGGVGRG